MSSIENTLPSSQYEKSESQNNEDNNSVKEEDSTEKLLIEKLNERADEVIVKIKEKLPAEVSDTVKEKKLKENIGFILSQLLQKIYEDDPKIEKETIDYYKDNLNTVFGNIFSKNFNVNDMGMLNELIDSALEKRKKEMIHEDEVQKRDRTRFRRYLAPLKNVVGLRVDEHGNSYVGDVPVIGHMYAKTYDALTNSRDNTAESRSSTANRSEFNQSSVEGLENQKKHREERRLRDERSTLGDKWRTYFESENTTNGGSKKKTRKISKKERGRKPKKTIKSLKPKKTIKSIKLKKSKKSRKPKKH
tara:strand:+ start:10 stop:921 length:912 start_codon:yes stop_codon:yes gene_type:complete